VSRVASLPAGCPLVRPVAPIQLAAVRKQTNRWLPPQAAIAVAVTAAVVCVVIVFFWLPTILISPDAGLTANQRFARENDVRTTGLQLLAGLLALAAVLTGYRSYRASREGQITDRFTRAAEQLGHAEVDVRVGGIFGLERLMRDSPTDQPAIVEVLCSFVRNRGRPRPIATSDEQGSDDNYQCPADVQAAVTVVGRRPAIAHDATPDFTLARLNGADLRGLNLAGGKFLLTIFAGADMEGVNLTGAMGDGADFSHALLDDAILDSTEFIRSHFEHAIGHGVRARGARLGVADFRHAHFENSDFSDSVLNATQLEGASFEAVDLRNANLTDAQVVNASFRDTDLRGTRRANVEFHRADTTGARWDPTPGEAPSASGDEPDDERTD